MIPLLAIIIALAWVAMFVTYQRRLPARRHRRCLQNIEQLESELEIGRPMKTEALDYRIGPGVVWKVDDPNDIRFFDPSLDPKSELARKMMARGMLYSGEYEAAVKAMDAPLKKKRELANRAVHARRVAELGMLYGTDWEAR